jgi:lipopolysaccharide biosynthesis protein
MSDLRLISIYLPQFHPIPENNEWWGKGFTEWRNVVNSKPLFHGHYQPHLPADLGYYDLRLNEVFHEQIKLAKEAGIYGFMFYEYWFEGKRLLEKPIENYLNDNEIDFPYFLCWANENWTRRWDGQDNEILLKQSYNKDDYSRHFDEVYARHIISGRYIKIHGKPVIAVYKPYLIPNLNEMLSIWRNKSKELGFNDLYLISCESQGLPEKEGFDAYYEFQPNWKFVSVINQSVKVRFCSRIISLVARYLPLGYQKKIYSKNEMVTTNKIIDYKDYVHSQINQNSATAYKRFPCVMPGWDNSPRRKNGNAVIFHNSTPKVFSEWLNFVIQTFKPYSDEENFIFINAWNEWAEGAHLEPCQYYGQAYLRAVKDAQNK